jgi:hypothetical protein
MKYEQVETFDEVAKVAEKKEENMEEVPRPTMQSMVKIVLFSIELESWRHSKVNSTSIYHKQKLKVQKFEKDLSIVQCYKY